MIPLRVWVKNFLSFGDEPGEFRFTDGDPLWVVRGPNGVGKSAVFDAISYALYGEHRGGKNDADQLIRHGANEFEVEFDFLFAGTEYRIRRTRNRKRAGGTTQRLWRKDDGAWVGFRGGDVAGAVAAKDIERWVEETVGLEYKAFTKSVLLRQGKADELFTATGPERQKVLKEIMGFERFEGLSERVHVAARACDGEAKVAAVRLGGLSPVTADERAAAAAAVAAAAAQAVAAREVLAAAATRVERAVAWESLEKQRADLDGKLAAAAERAARGEDIRKRKQALDDLSEAVPALRAMVSARGKVADGETAAAAAADRLATATADRDAAAAASATAREKAQGHRDRATALAARIADLGRQVEADDERLTRSVAVGDVDAQLARFPADLAEQIAAAVASAERTEQADREASDAKTRAEAALAEVGRQRARFATVENDPVCSYCGQAVDAAHAAKERGRLGAEEAEAAASVERAASEADATAARRAAARAERSRLERHAADRDKLIAQRGGLAAAGPVEPADALRGRLADARRASAEAEREREAETQAAAAAEAEVAGHETSRKAHGAAVSAAEQAAQAAQTALAVAASQQAAALARLSAAWQARLPSLDPTAVDGLAAERAELAASDVEAEFRELEQDDARRAGWEADRAAVAGETDAIPPADRLPAVQARAARDEAQQAADAADAWLRSAAADRDALAVRQAAFEEATAAARAAAERHRLHKKLDDLLGGKGLQLDLVRDAEAQIVAHANETLGHLSDGDLALEEDAAADAGKAFDLKARRAGGDPIGVSFLSGSQRFRVAVAVALAVGRFASGRARPLEAVVIDEGFGSLDKDGLRAMADELKRLQRAAALRRVILVSHQDEFTDLFPVGYELTPGEAGTVARPFRRG